MTNSGTNNYVLEMKTVQIAPVRTLMTALKDILLETNPTIREACAFGVEDEVAGEIVGVAIVANEGTGFEFQALKKWVKERLSKEKVPSKWFLLDEIPKTDRGKVNRFNVADLCTKKSPLKA